MYAFNLARILGLLFASIFYFDYTPKPSKKKCSCGHIGHVLAYPSSSQFLCQPHHLLLDNETHSTHHSGHPSKHISETIILLVIALSVCTVQCCIGIVFLQDLMEPCIAVKNDGLAGLKFIIIYFCWH